LGLVPKHIKALKPYIAGKSKKEFEREFRGITPVKLASNENPLGASPKAIQAAEKSLIECNRYPDSSGFELRTKLAELYNLNISNVILGAGSEGIMSNIMRTFLSEGDTIVSSSNSFIGFRVLADASGHKTLWAPMHKYHYDLNAILERIDKTTKIVYLANPDNPTGTYFNRESFDLFMSKVPKRVLIILDEAYYEYAQHIDNYPDSMIYRYDNIITLRTFSKVFGLAGFRVGYGFAHSDLISNLLKVKLPFEPSIPAQEAALASLKDEAFIQGAIILNKDEKKLLYDFFEGNEINYIKSATNFITLVFENKQENISFCDALLTRGVIVRNLSSFGLDRCARVTIGTKEENQIFKKACIEVVKENVH